MSTPLSYQHDLWDNVSENIKNQVDYLSSLRRLASNSGEQSLKFKKFLSERLIELEKSREKILNDFDLSVDVFYMPSLEELIDAIKNYLDEPEEKYVLTDIYCLEVRYVTSLLHMAYIGIRQGGKLDELISSPFYEYEDEEPCWYYDEDDDFVAWDYD